MVANTIGTRQYDFAVYDRTGRLAAVVEAKRRFKTSSAWAREWHQTSTGHASAPTDALVLLVTPDRIYAWDRGAASAAPANWEFDADRWIAPYFNRLRISPHEVAPHVFEQIVGLWLRDVTEGGISASAGPNNAGVLLTTLEGGEVVEQAAA